MTTVSLTLSHEGKHSFIVNLFEDNIGQRTTVERIITEASENNCVFSDLCYDFSLNSKDLESIRDVRVYINDTYEPSVFYMGKIRFPDKNGFDRKIFMDCYGFVELQLKLIMEDKTELNLSSQYIPVLVHRNRLNESVKAMVNYVYQSRQILLNGTPKPRDITSLKENGSKSLQTQIILAEEIAAIYEKSYGYFKANSRFHIEKTPTIEHFEQLQEVTPATLEYIVSHPEQLTSVNANSGIRIGTRVYQPKKTLAMKNVSSYDIYENRVILSFLRKMVDETAELRDNCRRLLSQIPDNEDYNTEYIYSSFFMFSETRKSLEKSMDQLTRLYDKFTKLWGSYKNALPIPLKPLYGKPRPTALFLSVPQYHKVFVSIHQWFNYGSYDFEEERFILSFVKISTLYESYLLAKLTDYFVNRGYSIIETKLCKYPISHKWMFKNSDFTNTFCFYDGRTNITLYYQPVIYDTNMSEVNGIGLYRNNSIPINIVDENDFHSGGHYYVPDFLLKIEDKDSKKYLIMDAKFSEFNTVWKHHIKDLAFKYLFSISPIEERDKIYGLCVLYGKCLEEEQLRSAYDNCLPDSTIQPIAQILPLIEGIANEDHYYKLDSLFKMILE